MCPKNIKTGFTGANYFTAYKQNIQNDVMLNPCFAVM